MIEKKTEIYQLHKDGEQEYLTFCRLDQYKELRHLFTTRHGGVSEGCCASWNFGERHLDTEENICLLYTSAGDLSVLASFGLNKGDLIMCLAVVVWAAYGVYSKSRCAGISPVAITYYSFLVCTLCLLYTSRCV